MKGVRQLGAVLIELLIASFIGALLLSAALSTIYSLLQSAQIKQRGEAYQAQVSMAQYLLTNELQAIDFSGCFKHSLSVANLQSNGVVAEQLRRHGALHLESLDTAKGVKITSVIVPSAGFDLVRDMTALQEEIDIESGAKLSKGDEVLLSDCSSAEIFTVTGTWRNRIKHLSTGNSSGNFSALYKRGATLYPLSLVSYEIYTGSSGVSGLYRREGGSNRQELLPKTAKLEVFIELHDEFRRKSSVFNTSDRILLSKAHALNIVLHPLADPVLSLKPIKFTIALLNRH